MANGMRAAAGAAKHVDQIDTGYNCVAA